MLEEQGYAQLLLHLVYVFVLVLLAFISSLEFSHLTTSLTEYTTNLTFVILKAVYITSTKKQKMMISKAIVEAIYSGSTRQISQEVC